MARLQLKERQFEPTGNNLGFFGANDLESFDIQYTDSDVQDEGQEGGGQDSKQPQSHVPDPFDENPLKDQSNDNKQKNSDGNGGQSGEGGSSSGDSGDNSGSNENSEDDVETPDDLNVPDEWDPYGNNPDEEDPDLPDSSNSGDAGYGSSDDGEEDSDDEIMPSSGNEPDEADTSDPSQGSGSGEDGEGSDGNQSDGSDTGQSGSDSNNNSGEGSEDNGESGGESDNTNGNSENGSGQGSTGDSNSSESDSDNGNSNGNGSSSSSGGQGQGNSSSQAGSSYSDSSDKSAGNKSQQAPPTEEELEAEDEDFNPSDEGDDLSDLEKALDTIDNNSTDSQKSRNKSQNQEGDSSEDNRSRRDIEDEAAAAKDMVGKAVQDVQAENKDNNGDEDDDDYRRSRDFSEDEDDILKDLGAGNLTSLFNPGNLKDWRSRLDKLFDKATGFDIITNPNLINKKIEDAPPGREDEDPQLKNIVVLIDLSGSMGADKFKQVISHVDTMIRARKLTSVWFHIIGFGDDNIRELERWYTKVKGSRFKQTMMTKYKNDAGWGTRITPGFELAAIKVHKPDAIIVMTDAEIFDGASTLERNSKAKTFVKKYKNKIIWALTQGASLNKILEIDPTLKAKKRYIKFKKDGKKY